MVARRYTAEERERVKLLMAAIDTDDADAFFGNLMSERMPWCLAFRQFVKLETIPEGIQAAFQAAWIENNVRLCVAVEGGSDRLICDVVRRMFPPYEGPAIRLFRGATWYEHQSRNYGLSWSEDAVIAERFARDQIEGGFGEGLEGVVLETLAPPRAIISKITYPAPLSEEGKLELTAEYGHVSFREYHDEREYLVDQRALTDVHVAKRFYGESAEEDEE